LGARDGIQAGSIVCAKHQLRLLSSNSLVFVEAGSKGRVLSTQSGKSVRVEFGPPILKEESGRGASLVDEAIVFENLSVYSLILASERG